MTIETICIGVGLLFALMLCWTLVVEEHREVMKAEKFYQDCHGDLPPGEWFKDKGYSMVFLATLASYAKEPAKPKPDCCMVCGAPWGKK